MEFGLPKVKSLKTEKYENDGVLTFLPTGPGLGRKMSFNKKAAEMMGLDDENLQISFSFSAGAIHIVNTAGTAIAGLTVSKTGKSVSDKKHYEYIKYSLYNSTEKDELELFLSETENSFEGRKVFLLEDISKHDVSYGSKEISETEVLDEEYVSNVEEEFTDEQEVLEEENYVSEDPNQASFDLEYAESVGDIQMENNQESTLDQFDDLGDI